MLETAHPRIPATFAQLFLGALNLWIRVYDYRNAQERVETLRESYESDPECERIELPDIDRATPRSMKRRALPEKTLSRMLPRIRNRTARRLIERAVELDVLSRRAERPVVDEEVGALLMDCGEPLPSLLAVFEPHDVIEGCFDEDAQGMYEVIPEPNLILRLNGEDEQSVREAFQVLAVLCETLACASKLIKMMPGNERLPGMYGGFAANFSPIARASHQDIPAHRNAASANFSKGAVCLRLHRWAGASRKTRSRLTKPTKPSTEIVSAAVVPARLGLNPLEGIPRG